ncbi:MAG TPA: FixH family protein [Burkholderiales bacterium]
MTPWYRQRWPWLIMAGPLAVLVAGAVTTWIAFASADGLVAEDYYKQGMGINRRLAREEAARRQGISAQVELSAQIAVTLQGAAPEALFVHLAHATRAGHDVRLRLVPSGGKYVADLPPLPPGRWRIVIEDPRGAWLIQAGLR